MKARYYFGVRDDSGAMISPLRTEGKVTPDADEAEKAIRYLRSHAEDYELLMDILGLTNDQG